MEQDIFYENDARVTRTAVKADQSARAQCSHRGGESRRDGQRFQHRGGFQLEYA